MVSEVGKESSKEVCKENVISLVTCCSQTKKNEHLKFNFGFGNVGATGNLDEK